MSSLHGGSFDPNQVAWRGFVTQTGIVIAWPLMLSDHNTFHYTFSTDDEDFAARWRQWSADDAVDFDGSPSEEVKARVYEFLRTVRNA